MRRLQKIVLQILTLCFLTTLFVGHAEAAARKKSRHSTGRQSTGRHSKSRKSSARRTSSHRSPSRSLTPDPRFALWEQLDAPKEGSAHIYGGYARGCIAGAQELPIDGPGYEVINLEQKRNFGHPALVSYVRRLALTLHEKKSPTLLIEDISGPRGGPFSHGHQSHQIGLDVDISYSLPKTVLTMGQRAKRQEITFVDPGQKLLPTWTADQTRLVFYAASSPEVNRIFVAPAVKKFFCEKFPTAPWQYKLRPLGHHEDHLHVRLECPADQPDCVHQPLNAADTACGPGLDNSIRRASDRELAPVEEAAVPKAVVQARGFQPFPNIPAACAEVRK